MYKAVTLAGGIREPLLTCSSFYCFSEIIRLDISCDNIKSYFLRKLIVKKIKVSSAAISLGALMVNSSRDLCQREALRKI